jgi:hypothetical protein
MSKKNLILGVALLLLVLIAYVYSGPFKEWKADLGKPANFLAKLDVSKISAIEVTGGEKTMVVNKAGDRWRIDGTKDFYLTESTAKNLIDSLVGSAESDLVLVSENSESKEDFEISESKGRRVILRSGETVLADFFVGKNTPDFSGSYIGEPKSDNTYEVKTRLSLAFDTTEWYDKTIFRIEKDLIDKIRFQFPSREFTVEKQALESGELVWGGTLPYKFPVNAEKISEIVDSLSGLQAVYIPEQTFEGTGLEKNLMIIEVSGEGFSHVLMVGEADENNQYYAKKGDSDNIYLIAESDRNLFEKRISDLR